MNISAPQKARKHVLFDVSLSTRKIIIHPNITICKGGIAPLPHCGGGAFIMVSMFFGLPGCGKSTLACKFIKKYINDPKVKNIYVNFPVTFDSPKIKIINNDDFGKYDLRDGVIIIDEATIFADSRGFKTFDKNKVQYLLLHRHYKVNILLFSQGYNAVDKKLRDLTVKLYYVKRCKWLKFLTAYCPIKYGIMFPQGENLGEIAEGYSELPLLAKLIFTRFCFRPRYYRYFDSYDAPRLAPLPPRV